MDTSPSSAQATDVGAAVQSMMLNSMRTQGAQLNNMLNSIPKPQGSVNSPSQGTHIDAWA
jgi:hypothetical protein